ncbi:MAG: ATPase V [Prevotellaceae bacterium]|nr:ATPase V [Prevotellaceae bacterium]
MKKLTFLVYHREYEQFLEQIRELGVVHIVEKQRGEPDETLQEMLQKRARYKQVAAQMDPTIPSEACDSSVRPRLNADDIVKGFEEAELRLQTNKQRIAQCEKAIAQLAPWGNFDWNTIEKIKEAGWFIQFYLCPEREYKPEWEEKYPVIQVGEQAGSKYFVTLTPHPLQLELEPVRLPDSSLFELEQQKVMLEEEQAEYSGAWCDFCVENRGNLEKDIVRLERDIDLCKVKLSGQHMAEGTLLFLEGWVPADKEADLTALLEQSGVYYEMRNATRQDNAPIKLRNNAFTRMYEVLTRMYGMPDYAEFDPTPLIAPFFTLFFGFCMGDAGYGLVLMALGFFLKKKVSKSMAGMMNLVITLGVATTVVGTVMGTFFGVSLIDLDLPENLKSFMIVGKVGNTGYDKQMLLAILIGVVQISFGMAVKAISETVRYGFKNALSAWGWLLLVVGFVCTGTLTFFHVISEEVSTWAFITIGGVAAIGIYLLNNWGRNVFINVGAGLWDTYNMATGLMGDTLSYIRLYALGLAGGMLGGVFNELAFMVRDGAGGIGGWICCLVILLLGHGINIAMSCLSAYVHPLRLTFVEYFKNSGYDGKGEAYKPFGEVSN